MRALTPDHGAVNADFEDRPADRVDEWRRRWRERDIDHERERDDPWALPLVVRVERAAAPTHEAALRAAAGSVVALLSHPDATGPWHSALARWSDGWIRKVVRRARASRWEEVGALPGVTARSDDAEVRALLPHPVADPPPALARLQITGLDLPKDPAVAGADAMASTVLTIAIAPNLALTTGKACAQVGHAAQLALLELDRSTVLTWLAAGHPVRVVDASPAEWDRLRHADRDVALVQDGGFTEVAPGTHTCAASFDRIGERDPASDQPPAPGMIGP
jgi:peptidyl-tRNA hydrolase